MSADNPVMMMGTVVFEFSHGGRSFDLEFGVLKGGDTGSADVIVGNYVLRSDRYDGAVDVGAGVVTLRKVDSRGGDENPRDYGVGWAGFDARCSHGARRDRS